MSAKGQRWRLIVDGELAGARNMARDVAMLDAVIAKQAPPTLRLYGWSPPCLTLGRHQGLDAADLDFCKSEGIDVARRPTGGRAVLHHLELTYAIVAPLGEVLPSALQDAYRRVCAGLVRAARSFGIAAELTGGEVNLNLPGPRTAVPCFEAPAGGEVVVAGRKLIGSSARTRQGCLLQHGAILLGWDGRLQAGAMGLADDRFLREHVTTFSDELGHVPSRPDLAAVVAAGISEELGVVFDQASLSETEAMMEGGLEEQFSIARAFR